MSTLVILPNTLFKKKYIPKEVKKIIVWENPHYFTKYKYNYRILGVMTWRKNNIMTWRK